ncbi:MAG: archaetidylserine decarboxylase [Pseudomonadota bacterium]
MPRTVKPSADLTAAEQLNFLLTNRIPRRLLTRFMGWYSQLRSRRLTRLSMWFWRQFADDLRMHESATQEFNSLHECFTRRLKPGARPVCTDTRTLISPCDAVVGEFGAINGFELIQAKGFPYTLSELLCDTNLADQYRNGLFVTLRLKSSMYHHFHAPADGWIEQLSYISGDTWNVNPIALKKVEKLFCRNERAVIPFQTTINDETLVMVPVAAVLVASMRFHGIQTALNLQYRGPNVVQVQQPYKKGDPIGYFEHGSTIVLLLPPSWRFSEHIVTGQIIRMGQPLLYRQQPPASSNV